MGIKNRSHDSTVHQYPGIYFKNQRNNKEGKKLKNIPPHAHD